MPALDSLGADSARGRDSTRLVPANVADSAAAAAYSVIIARFNTQMGVQQWLQKHANDLPSPAFIPVRIQGEMWYAALAGSYATRRRSSA